MHRNPKGTRDFYPDALLMRRLITEAWRRTALLHGFDEIDGPTFEHLELYTVKSGQEIVSQLFSFTHPGGDEPYALRPEFTPTLARMYAARARELPVPTRWFCTPAFFRAERPQRGRLREFLQWNVDVIGDPSPDADAEVIACAIDLFRSFGMSSSRIAVHVSNRHIVGAILGELGVGPEGMDGVLALLDRRSKLDEETFAREAAGVGLDAGAFAARLAETESRLAASDGAPANEHEAHLQGVLARLGAMGLSAWCRVDLSIVRGLAYYTGTVFEVIVAGERAVAGGGRYDNLIELFGGPPTPAVGFGMGDVVLSLVLGDDGLLPTEGALLDHLSRPMPTRPDAFVIGASPEAEAVLPEVLMTLRGAGLHARRTYKTTRKIGKLLADASACHARFAVIIESDTHATLKRLATGEQQGDVPLEQLGGLIAAGREAT